MLYLCCPTEEETARVLRAQSALPFSYPSVGVTLGRCDPPAGFLRLEHQVLLGQGERCFAAACAALARWEMYPASWFRITADGEGLEAGRIFVNRIHHLGVWSLNGCRIIDTLEGEGETGSLCQRGLAFGTLPSHEEAGEERFRVTWDRQSDAVHYDILSYSRPQSVLSRIGAPVVRLFQQRFLRESSAALIAAAAAASAP